MNGSRAGIVGAASGVSEGTVKCPLLHPLAYFTRL